MVGVREAPDGSSLQPSGSSLLGRQGVDAFQCFLGGDPSPGFAGYTARRMAVVWHLRMAPGVEAVAERDIAHLTVVGVAASQ